jgi:hypothetical protein
MNNITKSLKVWFIIHFIVYTIFGILLIFDPKWPLNLFGIPIVSTLTPRLLGAAFFAIGSISIIVKNDGEDVYRAILTFKMLWSSSAMMAVLFYILEGGNTSSWFIFAALLMSNCIWTYYRIKLNQFLE